MITPTPVFSPLDGARGCDDRLSKNQLIFVESDGDIDRIDLSANNKREIIGTGYTILADVKVSRDGQHAYVTDGQGLLRVDLNQAKVDKATAIP